MRDSNMSFFVFLMLECPLFCLLTQIFFPNLVLSILIENLWSCLFRITSINNRTLHSSFIQNFLILNKKQNIGV